MPSKPEDLTGRRFGKLTVIGLDPDYIPTPGRHAKWLCKCDCGATRVCQSNHLKDGSATACSIGCKNRIEAGTRFGNLVILEMTDQKTKTSSGGHVLYRCRCDCGNEELIASSDLRTGRRKTCKQCKTSLGELEIQKLLDLNSISYIKEYCFPDCKNEETNKVLRFDFYLPDYNSIIEYDGEQHFIQIDYFGGNGTLESNQRRDKIKNEYCLSHNIPIVRIPYTLKGEITLQDLLPETSKYRINE